jgi:hypothetical protein
MRKSSTNFLPYITSIGGLLSYEFLHNLRSEDPKIDYLTPETFKAVGGSHPLSKRELGEQITDAWTDLLETWDSISLRYEKMELSDARTKWIIPLLETLGFDPQYNKQNVIAGEDGKLSFRISHKGFNDANATYINCVAPSQNLEEVAKSNDDSMESKRRYKSPHDELQSFLNVSKGSKWGIVTNGISFRILRQFYHTTTKAYVEFDLENIFRSRSFSDFRLLYRTAHVSRFLLFDEKKADDKTKQTCILEEFYEQSKAAGVSAGEDLRKNVKVAIESLANGFLTPDLAQKMAQDEDFCRNYYAEILRVIYRMIFLLFAEQRGMLPTRGSLYAEEYSMNRLREIAIQTKGRDDHTDLWEGLKITFRMLKQGCEDPEVGVFAYNGTLFDDLETPILSELSCKNSDLCVALRQLTSIQRGNVSSRINYLDLGVEEIGSIYESLLDYTPRIAKIKEEVDHIAVFPGLFYLDPRGASRKTTGSYYTDRRLIDELIHSALEPVVKDRLSKANDKESVLLSIKVCDPACGSGAFLIAANNFLARELAKMRTRDQLEPSEKEIRRARREVLQHCIYGVDVNPMAVELTKVSLWINASVESVPLNFLDHHIKCGNSLIGATPELIRSGIPSDAFKPVTGDNHAIAKKMERLNKAFPGTVRLEDFIVEIKPSVRSRFEELSSLSEKGVIEVEEKKRKYSSLITSEEYQISKSLADAWTATFFWEFANGSLDSPISSIIQSIERKGPSIMETGQTEEIHRLSEEYHFFHWYLEFPDVFTGSDPGFDCVLGNPPWEKIKLQEREFFEYLRPEIAAAKSAQERHELIDELKKSTDKRDIDLWANFLHHRARDEKENKFLRASGKFPLSARGDFNTYAIFLELATCVINSKARIGMIVKTDVASGDTTKDLFSFLLENRMLISLIDVVNSKKLFPDVGAIERFCLLTCSNKLAGQIGFKLSVLNETIDEIVDEKRSYLVTQEDVDKMNPNTRTCPLFHTKEDAMLCREIYSRNPPIVIEKESVIENNWGIEYYRMFDMTNDSRLFERKESLEEKGFRFKKDSTFVKGEIIYVPLYEGKLFYLYDYRHATFEGVPESRRFLIKAEPSGVDDVSKQDIDYEITPRYWVKKDVVLQELQSKKTVSDALFLIRNASQPMTNARVAIGSLVPQSGASNGCPVLIFRGQNDAETAKRIILFEAMFNSITFDYVLRQKMSTGNVNKFILYQVAGLVPDKFALQVSLMGKNVSAADLILQNVHILQFNTKSMSTFFSRFGLSTAFIWDNERRSKSICIIDALIAHLYGLTRPQYEYILSQFNLVENQEMKSFGEFRTKRMCLEYYDKIILEKTLEAVRTN